MPTCQRAGITAAGNWIVDRVKTCDCLPDRGLLANITAERRSTGGAPANVLGALAQLRAPFPLAGFGLVGDDADGRFILENFRQLNVDVSGLRTTPRAPTSYTDVMNDAASGERVFFHCRGANAFFGPEHVPYEKLTCRIFHLGYVLLLDRLDAADRVYGTQAARVLHRVRQRGIRTSLDVVSEDSDRFRTLVPPALRYVDYLILNEVEAARVVGITVRRRDGRLDGPALARAVDRLCALGDMQLVVVHMPEGAYLQTRDGRRYARGSLRLPQGFIQGVVGAGDAFCAGLLYGLHEGWDHAASMHLGTCCAAASLSQAGATEGIRSLRRVLALGKQYPEREPPVQL